MANILLNTCYFFPGEEKKDEDKPSEAEKSPDSVTVEPQENKVEAQAATDEPVAVQSFEELMKENAEAAGEPGSANNEAAPSEPANTEEAAASEPAASTNGEGGDEPMEGEKQQEQPQEEAQPEEKQPEATEAAPAKETPAAPAETPAETPMEVDQ